MQNPGNKYQSDFAHSLLFPKHLNISYEYIFIMPRPRRLRRVRFGADVDYFKPRGVPVSEMEKVNLNIEELEAIRLKDYEGKPL